MTSRPTPGCRGRWSTTTTGGKAGLFITALRQTGEDVVAAIYEAGLADLDNWLAAGLAAFFDHIQANPIALTALLRHGSPGGEDRQVLDEIRDRVLALILACLGSPGDSAVLQSVLRGWIAMVETMGREWLRRGEPTREELETLLPELLRAVLGTAAWHDAAVAAVLPSLPPLKPQPKPQPKPQLKQGAAAPVRRPEART
jgi:AcrR family transcriptional regulator